MNTTQLLAGIGFISLAGGLTIYSGVSTQEIVVFNFDGSTSMRPIIEFLLDKYSKEQEQPISFNISAIGSNSGLQKLLQGTAEFALVSHDISHLPKDDNYKDSWKTRQLKTVTLATESMVVLYKPPKECTSELTLSESNIKKVFSVFSGHKAEDVAAKIDLKDLLDGSDDKCKSTIYSWVKSTGPIKSGTAKSFVSIPLLKDVCNGNCNGWYDKVKSSYGSDYPLNYVPESTPLHWNSFKNNLRDGAITYLPSNFVLQNWDEITSLGIKFAKYQKKAQEGGGGKTEPFTWAKDIKVDSQTNEWQRSFNIVFSVDDLTKDEKKKKLITFIIEKSKDLTDLHLTSKCYTVKSTNGKQPETTTQCPTKEDGSKQQPEEIDLSCFDNTEDKTISS